MGEPGTEVDTEVLRVGGDSSRQLVVEVEGVHVRHQLPTCGEVTVGRSKVCTIVVDHVSVSRLHLRIRLTAEHIEVADAGSANGSVLRGAPLGRMWTPINTGEVIQIGLAVAVVRGSAAVSQPRRVWSHGYFEGRVEEECDRSQRSGRPFAVLRLNVEGSAPNRALEQALASTLRSSDVLALYAPGELEVLLAETGPDGAELVRDRLRDRLIAAGIVATMGLACFPRDDAAAAPLLAIANRMVRGRTELESDVIEDSASEAMRGVHQLIEQVAPGSISVLIQGETGVGKEVCAELVHQLSTRKGHTFLRLNCAALSESLLESELFGHERGAFTGAVAAKPGLIESADGGTVFLDEIGELRMAIQVKLLRVLDEKRVTRVGAVQSRAVDVRFVAATNRDLEAEIEAGRFRQDLYFRLAGVTVSIPPLRERISEILPLATGFVASAARDLGEARPPAISEAARALLQRYTWPGNVRELRNVMERAALVCRGGDILPEHLPVEKMQATLIPRPQAAPPSAGAGGSNELDDGPDVTMRVPRTLEPSDRDTAAPTTTPTSLREELHALEKQRIMQALETCAGNQSAAARLLGISRSALVARIEEFGLTRPRKGRR